MQRCWPAGPGRKCVGLWEREDLEEVGEGGSNKKPAGPRRVKGAARAASQAVGWPSPRAGHWGWGLMSWGEQEGKGE